MLKNRWFRLLIGELALIAILFGGVFIVNLIPSKLAIENLDQSPTIFLKLAEAKEYSSSFEAVYNNLNRIDVMFKNPNLASRDELKLTLTDENNKMVASQEYSGFNLGDTSYARMDFAALVNSKGKNYTIKIVPTNLIDKKLEFGVKNNKSYFIQYYESGLSLRGAWDNTLEFFTKIFRFQSGVLLLPIILWGWYLW